jgi:phosphohistidine phosphatase
MKVPRKLLLLRHAKSSWEDTDVPDMDRPLNKRGKKAAHRMGQFMDDKGLRPALALVSAARRTQETWAAILPHMEGVPVSIEADIYEASKSELVQRLRRLDNHIDSVLVVGHSPGLPRLAESLAAHQGEIDALERLAIKYPTGALAELELDIDHWGELEAGSGRLISFVRPRDLGEDD